MLVLSHRRRIGKRARRTGSRTIEQPPILADADVDGCVGVVVDVPITIVVNAISIDDDEGRKKGREGGLTNKYPWRGRRCGRLVLV